MRPADATPAVERRQRAFEKLAGRFLQSAVVYVDTPAGRYLKLLARVGRAVWRQAPQHPVGKLPDGAAAFLAVFGGRELVEALSRLLGLRREGVIDFVGLK